MTTYITPTYRQRFVALLQSLLPLGAAYVCIFAAGLYRDWVAPLPISEQLPWIRLVLFTATVILAAFAYLCYRAGQRVWHSGQWPAPGTAVLFKTRVHTGWWAKLNAITFYFLALITVAALAYLLKFVVTIDLEPYLNEVVHGISCGP
ncbi:hypothetical protein [Shewanella sedimentimangrovi]|uniref:Uncharacterized protein n=1 Tax=Shewanella sedimentimangrovi TaxID=2814293 RepID=A0ABX7QY01_9GAMM|nr:hypothetical protein [Shewanella sedimentimangrovi]QSX36109.1 hypothetical protein JYB85_12275 [Shewanella sedimentimangrovi]